MLLRCAAGTVRLRRRTATWHDHGLLLRAGGVEVRLHPLGIACRAEQAGDGPQIVLVGLVADLRQLLPDLITRVRQRFQEKLRDGACLRDGIIVHLQLPEDAARTVRHTAQENAPAKVALGREVGRHPRIDRVVIRHADGVMKGIGEVLADVLGEAARRYQRDVLRVVGHEELRELDGDTLLRDVLEVRRELPYGLPGRRIDVEAELGREAEGAEHAKGILPEALLRLADGADDTTTEILETAEVIYDAAPVIDRHRVDREVTAREVLMK